MQIKNPDTAEKLANDVESAIPERLDNPLMFDHIPLQKRENIRIIGFMCGIM